MCERNYDQPVYLCTMEEYYIITKIMNRTKGNFDGTDEVFLLPRADTKT